MLLRRLTILLSLLTGLSLASVSQAHPHYFVTVKLDLDLDAQGRLLSLQQHWYFDELVSAILLDDMPSVVPGRPPAEVLDAESERMRRDLSPYDFYSHLKLAGLAMDLPDPTTYRLEVREGKQPGQNQVILHLRFDWSVPQTIAGKPLQLAVYDPTYYAAFSFQSLDNVTVNAPENLYCEEKHILPSPDDAMRAFAFSLDKTQRDSQGLGEHFAERVSIHCQQLGQP